MLPLASCEPSVQGGLLALGLLIAAVYLAAFWASVLRRPFRWQPPVTFVLGILVLVIIYAAVGTTNEGVGIVAGVLAAPLVGAAIWRTSEGVHLVRLAVAGVLGAALLPVGLVVLFMVAFGGGFACFN
jgi:hypothetical protein